MAVAHNSMNSDHQFLQQKPIMHHHLPDHKAEFKRDMENLVELLSKLNPSDRPRSSSPLPTATIGPVPRTPSNSTRSLRLMSPGISRRRGTVTVQGGGGLMGEPQEVNEKKASGEPFMCRTWIYNDPHSVLRFAFVEFADEQGAKAALNLAGTMLGYYPVKVLPSKTAILPVNPTFLPKYEDEREMCARTVYCTNIDKKASQADVKAFFKLYCGEVSRLRLLGDHVHSTRIAFVEFVSAESALSALNVSGAVLGSLPIRVSPSKTPVRPRTARATAQYQ